MDFDIQAKNKYFFQLRPPTAPKRNQITSHGSTYHLLVYVKPTKGRWWPEKAVWEGGGIVSWKKHSKEYFTERILPVSYKRSSPGGRPAYRVL